VQYPRLVFYISLLLLVLFVIPLTFFVTAKTYDMNAWLSPLDRVVSTLIAGEDQSGDLPPQPITATNLLIDKRIDSVNLLGILYYLRYAEVKSVIMPVDIEILRDYYQTKEMADFIRNTPSILSSVTISGRKGFPVSSGTYSRSNDSWKQLTYLKTSNPFFHANYRDRINFSNETGTPSYKIGTSIDTGKRPFNNSIDILTRFENKFLLSLPFLMYLQDTTIDVRVDEFSFTSIGSGENRIWFDQAGRSGVLPPKSIRYSISQSEYAEWVNMFNIRQEAVSQLVGMQMLNISDDGWQQFQNEEQLLFALYSGTRRGSGSRFEQAKAMATEWNRFTAANTPGMRNGVVFISRTPDQAWMQDTLGSYLTLRDGRILYRLPLGIITAILILISIVLVILHGLLDRPMLFSILSGVILILSIPLYLILRNFAGIDYPLAAIIISLACGTAIGWIANRARQLLWLNEVRSIYKGSASIEFSGNTARKWQHGRFSLATKQHLATFLLVDTTAFLEQDITEDDVEFIAQKIAEIENTIKQFGGVRNNFDSAHISCYFGNPYQFEQQADMAVDTARDIHRVPVYINHKSARFVIAIHTKNEWFKYIHKNNQKCYTFIGNSIHILSKMQKVAHRFGVNTILSETTFKQCTIEQPVRMLDRISIKGISGSIRLFELLLDHPNADEQKLLDYFHAGLKLFEEQKWKEASAYFRQCLRIRENDIPSQIYFDRCKEFHEIPPNEDWDGVYEVE
jgi:class 3 adenylate cyclase